FLSLLLYIIQSTPAVGALSLHDALPICGLVADAVRIALKWADKISEWMNKLSSALKNLSKVLDKFGSAGKSLRTKVDEFFNGLADRKSTRLNSSHVKISYAVFCLKKKK